MTITAGTYYIGIGDDPLRAVDTDGTTWDATGAVGAAPPVDFGTLARIVNTGVIVSPGNYRISLSIATGELAVPEPMTLGLLATALVVLGVARRTSLARRRQPRVRGERGCTLVSS